MPGTTRSKLNRVTTCSLHLSNASGFGEALRLQSATGKLHSAVLFGGIAQLVERQLCKLEVRGSNPLASSLRFERGEKRRLQRRSKAKAGSVPSTFANARRLRLGRPSYFDDDHHSWPRLIE